MKNTKIYIGKDPESDAATRPYTRKHYAVNASLTGWEILEFDLYEGKVVEVKKDPVGRRVEAKRDIGVYVGMCQWDIKAPKGTQGIVVECNWSKRYYVKFDNGYTNTRYIQPADIKFID